MALSVWEEIHSRFTGLRHPAFSRIQRATSSPSLPASVAMTRELICGFCSQPRTMPNCLEVSGMTFRSIFSGSMGRVSMLQVLYCAP